ncbi:hypothetical protein Cni_G27379 [Canna indica]|uniref:Uncharacterized protein n=1 Tax=Canna indica TaxID=4628 RepID=A0AAQ3L0P9_9LILI|nr:hypothetical protein Cni_G27379 [Canna indica]
MGREKCARSLEEKWRETENSGGKEAKIIGSVLLSGPGERAPAAAPAAQPEAPKKAKK